MSTGTGGRPVTAYWGSDGTQIIVQWPSYDDQLHKTQMAEPSLEGISGGGIAGVDLASSDDTRIDIGVVVDMVSKLQDAYAEIAALQAERKQMREALVSIAKNTCCDKCQEAALVARAALRRAPCE